MDVHLNAVYVCDRRSCSLRTGLFFVSLLQNPHKNKFKISRPNFGISQFRLAVLMFNKISFLNCGNYSDTTDNLFNP